MAGDDNFNPDSLKLTPDDMAGIAKEQAKPTGIRKRRAKELPMYERFLAGPVCFDWLATARGKSYSALWVGLCLWRLRGMKGTNGPFVATGVALENMHCDRKMRSRGLTDLVDAGLISLRVEGNKSAVVTILPAPSTDCGLFLPDALPAGPEPDDD